MNLLAISVGQPQTWMIQGKPISTAIIKQPVQGKVYISKKGPEGDKPAVHPDAVYAFSYEHYDYWSKELSADRNQWGFGFFGENLTISGIDETNLHVGDIINIGDQVSLQVVSPRIPCSKLAWRVGQPIDFLRRFSLSCKTGFYLKVLKEGYVRAGDAVEHVVVDPKAITIAELSRFFVTIDEATEEELYHVLSHEHLGSTARDVTLKRVSTIKDMALVKKGRWQGWREFKISKIISESCDVKSFYLEPVDQKVIGGYRPGQFLTCQLKSKDGDSLIRTWTISDFSPEANYYRISVKRIPDGKGSRILHDEMKEGDVIEVKPPNGSFILDRSAYHPVVLISAGIGITPMISMLKGHLERKAPLPMVYFVHVARNRDNHAFFEEVNRLIEGQENIKTLRFYTRPQSSDMLERDYDIEGHLTIDHLDKLMEGVKIFWGSRWHEWYKQECFFYLCGPKGFQDSVKDGLQQWGVKKDHIFSENFDPYSGEPVGVKADLAKVVFTKSGIEAEWNESDDLTLLELAEKCGIDAPNSCRMGVCETCECPLEKGQIYYEHGHLAKRSQQTVLTCCAKPGSNYLEIEL